MQEYEKLVEELEERRLELTTAEKLLHVPCTVFEGLAEAKKQMAGLQVVYALYREQAVRLSPLESLLALQAAEAYKIDGAMWLIQRASDIKHQ